MNERYTKVRETLQAAILGRPELTSREVAESAGVDLAEAWRFWRALGFARVPTGEHFFSQHDRSILAAGAGVLEREDVENDALLAITRVHGQAFARMAAAQAALLRRDISSAMQDQQISDAEAVDRVVASTETLLSLGGPFLNYAWRRHLVAAVVAAAGPHSSELAPSAELTVGFADLVGFTEVSENLTRREIALIIDRFEDLAYEQVPEFGGRVVKMIGDEVMFTSRDSEAALQIALGLVDACRADDVVPSVRVGLAKGPTLEWQGDVYGPAANLASRLVNVARPGSVLVSPSVAEAIPEETELVLRRLRRHQLKGIGDVHPVLVRRPELR